MKRVLRSAFEPLPRTISTPTLLALVGAVVLGMGVTVHRFLETSEPLPGPTASVQGTNASGTVWAQEYRQESRPDSRIDSTDSARGTHRRCPARASYESASYGSGEQAPDCVPTLRQRSPATDAHSDPASVFRPPAESPQSVGG